ncbi:complement factor H-like [Puntigrus tetrazona]|uniref:complement factor H-like n=1 Tax=Puntigrus tetrazona TaxID=1606681 RepID=UPI001C891BFA|nr:complement factor H-like [Puntigrus tetrazona]
MTSKINYRTCKSEGWSNTVLVCEEVTCELKTTKLGVISIYPEGKTIFKAGEKVMITCSERHWLIFTKETSKLFTCLNSGDWDHMTECAEISCEVPHNQHVYYPSGYFRRDLRLGVKKTYRCESGYRETAKEATCTRDGWTPNPLCAVAY